MPPATGSLGRVAIARKLLAALLLYLLLAVLVTWPLLPRLFTHLPQGGLSAGTVPLFNLFTLQWNADRLLHGYAGYWDAPIFHPTRGAFALSEPQPLTGLAFALCAALLGPVGGYNLVLLTMLALNALGARRVMRVLGAPELVATAVGALALALPFALRELGVLQQLALYPVLFALAELCAFSLKPTSGAIVRFALWLCALALSCTYHLLLFSVACVLALPLVWRHGSRKLVPACALALVLVLALAGPVLLGQRSVLAQYSRSTKQVRGASALGVSYLRWPKDTALARLLPVLGTERSRKTLSPGLVVLALAGLALPALWSRKREAEQPEPLRRARSVGRYLCVLVVAALVFSFGTRFSIAGISPYEVLLQRHWSGFAQLRSPYRFAALVHVALVLLAGLGLMRLWSRYHGHDSRRAHTLVLGLTALAWLELVPIGNPLVRYPREQVHAPWVGFVRAQHVPVGDRSAVIVAPAAQGLKTEAYEPTVIAMLSALEHRHPMVNGYSGFFPKASTALLRTLRDFPTKRAVRRLREAGVRYLVTDTRFVAQQRRRHPSSRFPAIAHKSAGRTVYRLGP